METIDIISDIATLLIYAYFIYLVVKKIRKPRTKKRWFYLLVLLGITFLLSRRLYDYL
jgi:predicted branched-subunit amino acid permease